jgi:hypothetical protein
MGKKKTTPEHEKELDVYKSALELTLTKNALPKWEVLDNEQRKSILMSVKHDTDEHFKDKARFYSIGYTLDKADKVQLMAIENFNGTTPPHMTESISKNEEIDNVIV